MTHTRTRSPADGSPAWSLLFAAWTIALAASLGALFMGEVVGQAPCSLCWYQRVFMFPLVAILGIAAFRGDVGAWIYAAPLTVVGVGIAAFHSLLYAGMIEPTLEPCGPGPSCRDADANILGMPLPFLSAAAFAAILALLLVIRKRSSQ